MFDEERDDKKKKPSPAGCILAILTLAVIIGVSYPVVRWRSPETGEPLPRMVAVFTPFLVGGVFHGIGGYLLRLLGLSAWKDIEEDDRAKEERPPSSGSRNAGDAS